MFYSIDISEKNIKYKDLDDLADDCLMTVSIFKKHIQKLWKRHAAPPLSWYVYIGTDSFKKLGYYDIANNYDFWRMFICEHIFAE